MTAAFDFAKWFLTTFSTREHFRRFLTTVIVLVAVHQLYAWGEIEKGWFFKNDERDRRGY